MKPIIFSTSMVQAILDDRKTQTRRVIRPQPVLEGNFWNWKTGAWSSGCNPVFMIGHGMYNSMPIKHGDILWVRETWNETTHGYNYKASPRGNSRDNYLWKPSIHMPKTAARIFLRVTDVQAERLQDISVADCASEGVCGLKCPHASPAIMGCTDCMGTGWIEPPQLEFNHLWDSLNFKRGFGWDINPWVWVYTFERIKEPKV